MLAKCAGVLAFSVHMRRITTTWPHHVMIFEYSSPFRLAACCKGQQRRRQTSWKVISIHIEFYKSHYQKINHFFSAIQPHPESCSVQLIKACYECVLCCSSPLKDSGCGYSFFVTDKTFCISPSFGKLCWSEPVWPYCVILFIHNCAVWSCK